MHGAHTPVQWEEAREEQGGQGVAHTQCCGIDQLQCMATSSGHLVHSPKHMLRSS
jgi:hypothetical protein